MPSHDQPEEKQPCASEDPSESKPKISYEETYKREAETARRTAGDPVVEGAKISNMRFEIAKPPFWMKSDGGLEAKKETVKAHPWMKENKKCKLNREIL